MKITIQKPCDKIDWTAMSDVQRGKFCSICSKSVIDFTLMNDEEIISFLNNSSVSICARLNQSQMNRILFVNNHHKIKHWTKIVATLSLLTFPALSHATNIQNIPVKTELNPNSFFDIKEHSDIQNTSMDSIPRSIKGRVIEEGTDIPVRTSVSIKETSVRVHTDSLGEFEIEIPSNYNKKEIILVIKSTGLEDDTEFIIYTSELPKHNVIINKAPLMIGEVVVLNRRKWWQFWKKKYKSF